jgi:hypothetical protein
VKQQRTRREHGLLSDIEEGLLANKPIADVLRMVIILGGKSGSAELRDWATKELNGYGSSDELPSYRIVAAPILLDGATPYAVVSRQSVAPSELPDFAQDHIHEEVSFRQGVGELDAMARQEHNQDVRIAIPGSRELARIMESQFSATQRIDRIYWSVSTIRVAGMVDRIRSRLAVLIGELRAATPSGEEVPSPEQTQNALNVVFHGAARNVTVNAVTSTGGGDISTSPTPKPSETPFWTLGKRLGALTVGAATIVATVIAILQVL